LRLFVNVFQPSFKLAGKSRDGAKVKNKYHSPATPSQRLLADTPTGEETRQRVIAIHAPLDPVRVLQASRTAQQELVEIADRPVTAEAMLPAAPTMEQFLAGLRTGWQEGRFSRPTDRRKRRRAADGVPTHTRG
jgi:hypothetical protein